MQRRAAPNARHDRRIRELAHNDASDHYFAGIAQAAFPLYEQFVRHFAQGHMEGIENPVDRAIVEGTLSPAWEQRSIRQWGKFRDARKCSAKRGVPVY